MRSKISEMSRRITELELHIRSIRDEFNFQIEAIKPHLLINQIEELRAALQTLYDIQKSPLTMQDETKRKMIMEKVEQLL